MKISILKSSAAGTVVYAETQTATTNVNGLVSIQIGAGALVTGTIAGINWGADSYYIKTETDPAGGTNYTIAGTTQLLSVPYALYSKNSGSGSGFTLPYAGTSSADNVVPFKITNTSATINSAAYFENTNAANYEATIIGKNNSTESYGVGVRGIANSNTAYLLAAGVSGELLGTKDTGAGVFGYATDAYGVYGNTERGIGVRGFAGGTGIAGKFTAPNGGTALAVNGALQLYSNNEGAGKVLTSDVAGNATWQDNGTPFIYFSSTGGSVQSIPQGGNGTVINTWTGIEETGGANYNTTTGEYVIPVTGYYSISANIGFYNPNSVASGQSFASIQVDNTDKKIAFSNSPLAGEYGSDISVHLQKILNAGQTVQIRAFQNGRPANALFRESTNFTVHLLHK